MTETFPIVPGQVRLLWVAVPLVLLILATAAAIGYSLSGARRARFEVSPAGLRLRGDFYGRLVPASDLRLSEARPVAWRLHPRTGAPSHPRPGTRNGSRFGKWNDGRPPAYLQALLRSCTITVL